MNYETWENMRGGFLFTPIDDCSGFAGSYVGFNPFKCNQLKGLKTHRGRGFASKSFKPSASADGKREDDGLWGLLILIAIFV